MFSSDPLKSRRREVIIQRWLLTLTTVYMITTFLHFLKYHGEEVYSTWIFLPVAFVGTYALQRFLVKALDSDVSIEEALLVEDGAVYLRVVNHKKQNVLEPKIFLQVTVATADEEREVTHSSSVALSHLGHWKKKEGLRPSDKD